MHSKEFELAKKVSLVDKKQAGYTLIELISVVILLAIVSSFFISKFNIANTWGVDSSVRELANKIEFLMQDASSRQVNYKLEFYENGSGYRVWQIAKKIPQDTIQVDLLKNLRSKKQQQSEEEKNAKQALDNLDEEFKKEQQLEQLPLSTQYYLQIFDDPSDIERKIAPLEYPSLVQGISFPPSLRILSVKPTDSKLENSDKNSLLLGQSITNPDYKIELNADGKKIEILVKPFERRSFINYLNE